jgi:murein L,D-transpeptidase YafK
MRVRLIYTSVALLIGVAALLWSMGRKDDPAPPPPDLKGVDRIVVLKAKRRMEIYFKGRVVRRYRIALGSSPVGDKKKKGDRRTPEGIFHIRVRNPESKYYLSLGLDYPNIDDARRGLESRLIDQATHDRIVEAITAGENPPQNTPLGGDIYIHGNGSHCDWTWGCVALDDTDMKELFDVAPLGLEVEIRK